MLVEACNVQHLPDGNFLDLSIDLLYRQTRENQHEFNEVLEFYTEQD